MMSVTREVTIFETAPPRRKPTARPIVPCSRMNLIKPFILTLYQPMCVIMRDSYLCVHAFSNDSE